MGKTTFAGLWESAKGLVTGFFDWLTGLGDMFLEAGKGLVNALWEGIKAAWAGLVENVSLLPAGSPCRSS